MVDCALAETDPLAAVRLTGWPHTEVVPVTVKKIAPQE
jgi:hypothetical protein